MPVPGASPSRSSSSDTAPARATWLRRSPIRNTHGTDANTISPAQPSRSVSREMPAASLPSAVASSTSIATPDHRIGAIARRCGAVAERHWRIRTTSTVATITTPITDVRPLKRSRSVSLRSISRTDSGQSGQLSCMRSV